MPYTVQERRDLIKSNPELAKEPGDWNLLFTLDYLEEWLKSGNSKYKTIHALRRASWKWEDPITVGTEIFLEKTVGIEGDDILTAKLAAYDEFNRRIVRDYEDLCILKNGDLKEYQEAENQLSTMWDIIKERIH